MIRIENLRKRFKKLTALDGINAVFDKGQVIALIGPNGSGKTTLIKTILGMVKADSGSVHVDGFAINGNPSYREKIGYMPQISRYPDNMKVGQLFSMIRDIRKVPEAALDNDLLVKFNLVPIFEKPMRTLSGGTRQKVAAALAFYFNPRILILDEPTAGLDPLSAEILKEKILKEKNKNKLVLISSHILSDLDELTSHVLYLQDGRMLFLKQIDSLRGETGESKLARAIAHVMKEGNKNLVWINEAMVPETAEKTH